MALCLRLTVQQASCRPFMFSSHRSISRISTYVSDVRRLQQLKDDDKKCQQYLKTGRFILYHKGRPLVGYQRETTSPNKFGYKLLRCDYSSVLQYLNDPSLIMNSSFLLGVRGCEEATWALSIPSTPEDTMKIIEKNMDGIFLDMRSTMFSLPTLDSTVVSKGNALLYWHHNFKYCNHCGKSTKRNTSGTLRICNSCGHHYFPQVSPVVITVLSSADYTKCLLVRQPRHIRGMYTAVAGYVEVGETLEDSVRREVAEEVGLEVMHLDYLFSQHWPLPSSSLMLGCLAVVDEMQQIIIDKSELEDAQWFCHSEIRETIEFIENNRFSVMTTLPSAQRMFIPPKGAVAYDLIEYWLKKSGLK